MMIHQLGWIFFLAVASIPTSSAFVVPSKKTITDIHHRYTVKNNNSKNKRYLYVDPTAQVGSVSSTTIDDDSKERKKKQSGEEKNGGSSTEKDTVDAIITSPLQLSDVVSSPSSPSTRISEEEFHRALMKERFRMEQKGKVEQQEVSSSTRVSIVAETADGDPQKPLELPISNSFEIQQQKQQEEEKTDMERFHRALLSERLRIEKNQQQQKKNAMEEKERNVQNPISSSSLAVEKLIDDEARQMWKTMENFSVNEPKDVVVPKSDTITGSTTSYDFQRSLLAARLQRIAMRTKANSIALQQPVKKVVVEQTPATVVPSSVSSTSNYEFQRSLLKARLEMEERSLSRVSKRNQDMLVDGETPESKPRGTATLLQPPILLSTPDVAAGGSASRLVEPATVTSNPNPKSSPLTNKDREVKPKNEGKQNAFFAALSSISPKDVVDTFTPGINVVRLKDQDDDEIIHQVVSNVGTVMKYGAKAAANTALAIMDKNDEAENKAITAIRAVGKSTQGVVSVLAAITALLWKKGSQGAEYVDRVQKERTEEQRKAEEARIEALRVAEAERKFQERCEAIEEEMEMKYLQQESLARQELHEVATKYKLLIDKKAEVAEKEAIQKIRAEIETEKARLLQLLEQNNENDLHPMEIVEATNTRSEIPFFAYML